MTSSPYTLLRCLWKCIQLEPCAIINSITTLCLVHKSTTSAIFHHYSVKCKLVPGASMILVELDSVAIWWTRQQTLPSAKFKRKKKKIGGITFCWLLYDIATACLHLLSCMFRENKFRTHIMADEAWKYPTGALHSFINHELWTRSDTPITICIQQT